MVVDHDGQIDSDLDMSRWPIQRNSNEHWDIDIGILGYWDIDICIKILGY